MTAAVTVADIIALRDAPHEDQVARLAANIAAGFGEVAV